MLLPSLPASAHNLIHFERHPCTQYTSLRDLVPLELVHLSDVVSIRWKLLHTCRPTQTTHHFKSTSSSVQQSLRSSPRIADSNWLTRGKFWSPSYSGVDPSSTPLPPWRDLRLFLLTRQRDPRTWLLSSRIHISPISHKCYCPVRFEELLSGVRRVLPGFSSRWEYRRWKRRQTDLNETERPGSLNP